GKRLRRRQHLVEGPRGVGVQVVLHQPQRCGLRVVTGEQRLHKGGVVHRGPSFPHFDIAPAGVELKGQQDAARPILLVFIMIAFDLTGAHWQDRSPLFDEKTRPLIETDERMVRVIRQLVLVEDVFHMPQIVAGNLAYAPLLREPGLEAIFFSTCRTLSCEMASVTPNCTSLSAIRCRVHRARPLGGSEQAIMVTVAATRLSSLRGRPLRAPSSRTSTSGVRAFFL